jgi:photoprotection regulator FRP-like protein
MPQNQNDTSTRAERYVRTESAWSHAEKKAARRIFDKAYRRECHSIRDKLKDMIAAAEDAPDIWRIHDYLSEERVRTDELFDYRYSALIFVFARLLADGLVTEAELNELSPEKVAQIRRIVER